VGPFAGAAVVGPTLGARMGHRINTRLLSLGFAGLLVLTGCYTAPAKRAPAPGLTL